MTIVCHVDDIDNNSSRGFEIKEQSLFIVKKDEQFHVYSNQCPHLGIELNWQQDQFLAADASLIQCATHGALFIIESGECIAGPCPGKKLQALPFSIRNGYITLEKRD